MKSNIILFFFFELSFFYFYFSLNVFAKNVSNMVFIEGGTYIPLFKISDNVNENVVNVKSFFMDKYPVTNCEFRNFILSNKDWSIEKISSIFADKNYLSHWSVTDFDKISEKPVVNISWFAADAYCSYLGKKLPSIDEWEYIANASKFYKDSKNDPFFLQKILDWYIDSQSSVLIDVNLMEENYFKVCGVHGNIWEWVEDFNSVILLNTDAEGGGLEEVLYCGAVATNAINPADYVAFMRYAFRNSLEANYTMSRLGFRCVKDVN